MLDKFKKSILFKIAIIILAFPLWYSAIFGLLQAIKLQKLAKLEPISGLLACIILTFLFWVFDYKMNL